MPIKVTATIVGNALNGFPRSLKEMAVASKRRLRNEAVEPTLKEIALRAKSLVPVSAGGRAGRKAKNRPGPGELRDTIRAEMSNTDAPVGYVFAGEGRLRRRSTARTAKGKKRAAALRTKSRGAPQPLGAYAMAVEYGSPHRGVAAEPFLRPAREGAAAKFQARCEAALVNATRDADRAGGAS